MTFNRNIPDDRRATSAVLINVSATGQVPTCRPDWLGHEGGGADVDALLTLGATIEELSATRRRTESSVRAHMAHLRNVHGLIIVRHKGLYRFMDPRDYEDFSEVEQLDDPDDALPNFVAQPVPKAKLTMHPEKPSPDAVLASDFCNWGAVARNGNGIEELFNRDLIKERCEQDPVSVIFMISGTDSGGVCSSVTAVATALRRIEEPAPHNWVQAQPNMGYYNYRYRDAESRVFYVGKGTQERVYQHVKEVFEKLRATPPKPLNGAKENAIAAQIPPLVANDAGAITAIAENISIEQFCDDCWSELVSFVVEKLYISHIYAAYDIANDTCGNSRHEVQDQNNGSSSLFRWVVQPKQVSSGPARVERWSAISKEFLQRGRLPLGSLAEIVWFDVEPLLNSADSVIRTLTQDNRLQWISAGPQSQTAVIQWNVVNKPYCIELVCSRKAPTVRVNLRPRRDQWRATPSEEHKKEFCESIAAHALSGCAIRIPDSRDCFVKPFSPGSDGRRDPDFSITDATLKTDVDVEWAEKSPAWTLIEAINALLNVLCVEAE